MSNLTLEKIKKQYEGISRGGVYYWFVPNTSFFWEKPRWVDVTKDLARYSDEQVRKLVQETPSLHFGDDIPLDDLSFDRYLKKEIRKSKTRDKLRAIYGKKRNAGPSLWFDASLATLVLVFGSLHVIS